MFKKIAFYRLGTLLSGNKRYEEVELAEVYRLGHSAVRISLEHFPVHVTLANAHLKLVIYPETLLDENLNDQPGSYAIKNAGQNFNRINGLIRLVKQGDSLVLGKHDNLQSAVLDYPDEMDLRRLRITHDGDGLIFKALVLDAEIYLSRVKHDEDYERKDKRWRHLKRIREIFAGKIDQTSQPEAMENLRQVNAILENEIYRPLDKRGMPGGLVQLPDDVIPVIIGDLHAQVNNLLTLLSHNAFLDALDEGKASLIILGDAVHSEIDGELDKMASSVLMMDLIIKLKIQYPSQVFYIRGNHDSFSNNVFKAGIAQCLMWEREIRAKRGSEYLEEFKRFYDLLPYVIISGDFVACHAAPIKTSFNRDMLINIYQHKDLIQQLTRNRLRRRNTPAGYSRSDVINFKRKLGVPLKTVFLVSHSPLNRIDPLWCRAGGIDDHHIVFSANVPWVGVFSRINGSITPISYYREDIEKLINEMN